VTQSWWFSIIRYKIQSSANKRVLDETDADTVTLYNPELRMDFALVKIKSY